MTESPADHQSSIALTRASMPELSEPAAPAGCEADARPKVLWDDELDGGRRFYTEDRWGNRIELLARA